LLLQIRELLLVLYCLVILVYPAVLVYPVLQSFQLALMLQYLLYHLVVLEILGNPACLEYQKNPYLLLNPVHQAFREFQLNPDYQEFQPLQDHLYLPGNHLYLANRSVQ